MPKNLLVITTITSNVGAVQRVLHLVYTKIKSDPIKKITFFSRNSANLIKCAARCTDYALALKMIKSCYSLSSKAASLETLENRASWRKFAVVVTSYTGLRSSNCQPAPEVGIGRASADEQESDATDFDIELTV
ncbi:hypothetical protein [Lactiplantibacillus pentosus]|uniref:hypothetical protein n=1 Tax=Lactiplantibacillus pentosus TaxID=1589 RepID=UPI001CDAA4F4|nr:hypothetical protein [Lactiplantibacillus pentosus]